MIVNFLVWCVDVDTEKKKKNDVKPLLKITHRTYSQFLWFLPVKSVHKQYLFPPAAEKHILLLLLLFYRAAAAVFGMLSLAEEIIELESFNHNNPHSFFFYNNDRHI